MIRLAFIYILLKARGQGFKGSRILSNLLLLQQRPIVQDFHSVLTPRPPYLVPFRGIRRLTWDILHNAEVPGWRAFVTHRKEDEQTPQQE
jgi:hypothetical protein